MSRDAECVSEDVTRTLRKPPPPHKRKAPVASKRRGRHDDRTDEASRQRRSASPVGLASDDAKAVGAYPKRRGQVV